LTQDAKNNSCGYQCFIIGGPFIAEDPACPTHGTLQRVKSRSALNPFQEVTDFIDERCVPSKMSKEEAIEFYGDVADHCRVLVEALRAEIGEED